MGNISVSQKKMALFKLSNAMDISLIETDENPVYFMLCIYKKKGYVTCIGIQQALFLLMNCTR